MLIGVAIFHIFPKELLLIFHATDEVLSIGIPALKTISLSFLLAGFCIVVGSVFQALENGLLSMLIARLSTVTGSVALRFFAGSNRCVEYCLVRFPYCRNNFYAA